MTRALALLALLAPGCVLLTEEDWSDEAWERECRELPREMDWTEVGGEVRSYNLGSDDDEVGRDLDEDVRLALVGHLKMSEVEVTRAQFAMCMGYDPGHAEGCGDRCPAESLTFHEAAAFTNHLSASDDLDPCYDCEGEGIDLRCQPVDDPITACEGYRLPTQDEWEVAARAGDDAAFSGFGSLVPGDAETCAPVRTDIGAVLGEYAWFCANAGGAPHAVGGLAPNAWGLYDVAGNVWEWTERGEYEAEYTHHGERPVRGGGFASQPADLRAANITWLDATEPWRDVGFRPVRTLSRTGSH